MSIRQLLLLFVRCILIGLLMLGNSTTLLAEGNLLQNPSFELVDSQTGRALHWKYAARPNGNPEYKLVDDIKYQGSLSLLIQCKDRDKDRGWVTQNVAIEIGVIYELSLWYRTEGMPQDIAGGPTLRLLARNESGSTVNWQQEWIINDYTHLHGYQSQLAGGVFYIFGKSLAEGEWKQMKVSFKVGEGIAGLDVDLVNWYSPGNVFFDDITFTPIPQFERQTVLAFPNPFTDHTTVVLYSPTKPLHIELQIYNETGEKVQMLSGDIENKIMWDGKDERGIEVGAGIYSYVILVENERGFEELGHGILIKSM